MHLLVQQLTLRVDRGQRGISRIELCAALGALVLLAVIVAPVLANSGGASERAGCFNNLRLVGVGIAEWGGDFQQRVPWRVSVSEGGTLPDSGTKTGNAWEEFFGMTNELRTPKILACPSDRDVKIANTFSEYVNSAFRRNATSYNVSLEVYPEQTQAWVAGDRTMKPDVAGGGCSARVNVKENITAQYSFTQAGWTNALHGLPNAGHLLLKDGSVPMTDTPAFRKIASQPDDNGGSHYLKAR